MSNDVNFGARDPNATQAAAPQRQATVVLAPEQKSRIAQLKAVWDANGLARDEARQRLLYVDGWQASFAKCPPGESPAHVAQRPRFAPNVLGMGLDVLSYLYSTEPIRTVEDEARWREILWDAGDGLSATLAYYDRRIRTVGTCLAIAAPRFGDGPDSLVKTAEPFSTVDISVVTRDRFEVIPHPNDGRFIGAAVVLWEVLQGPDGPVDVHYYFDDKVRVILHNWAPVSSDPHKYGETPCVTLKNTLSLRAYTASRLAGSTSRPMSTASTGRGSSWFFARGSSEASQPAPARPRTSGWVQTCLSSRPSRTGSLS